MTYPDLRIAVDELSWRFERRIDSEASEITKDTAEKGLVSFGCIGIVCFEMTDGRRRIFRFRDLGKPDLT